MNVNLPHMRSAIAEAEKFLRLLFSGGELIEIRGLRKEGRRVMRALCDNPRSAALAGAAFSNEGCNVYYAINPINPACFYAQRTIAHGNINMPFHSVITTAIDQDILCRRTYFMDVDPERAVKHTCSTDAEKATALVVATALAVHLRSIGFADPVWVDSGSGYHLLFKADGPIGDRRLKGSMKILSDMFSTPAAKLDRAVINDARIARLPGFRNMKGPDTPDRPHRLAKVIFVPAIFEVNSSELLQKIVGDAIHVEPKSTNKPAFPAVAVSIEVRQRTSSHRSSTGNLLLDQEGVLQLAREFPEFISICDITERGDSRYFALDPCPFAGRAHQGQQVGMGKTCIILGPNSIGFSCFSDDCAHHTFGELIKLLHKTTGRRFSRRVWAEVDLEPLVCGGSPTSVGDLAHAGCQPHPLSETEPKTADCHSQTDTRVTGQAPSAKAHLERELANPDAELKLTHDWQYNADTLKALSSPEFGECPLGTDPSEWGIRPRTLMPYFIQQALGEIELLHGEARSTRYRELQQCALRADDPAMGRYLGKEWLFTIARGQAQAVTTGELQVEPSEWLISGPAFQFLMQCTVPGQ